MDDWLINNEPFGEFNGSASDANNRGSIWTSRSFSFIWPTYALDDRIGLNEFGLVLVASVLANTINQRKTGI